MNVNALAKLKEIVRIYELFRSPGGKIISLPSGKGGVGKTVVALHLGAALTQFYATAVIDMNFALPNLHSYVRELPDKTLTHYLTGLCRLEEVEKVKVKVGNSVLHVYPSRSIVDIAKKPELEKIVEFLIYLKNKYDYIILDLPPGISKYSLYPVRLSDCVFIVTADEKASYLDATKISKIFGLSGVRVSGYIINKYEKKRDFEFENVVCKIPFSPDVKKFPEVWNKRYFKPKLVKYFTELAEKISQMC